MTPIIEVKNLSKKYRIGESQPYITLRDTIAGVFSNPLKSLKDGLRQDEFWALKDINFTVEPGEVVGIIGHNGAGKSTLLKILSRITPPTTGEITLRGRVGSLLEVGTGFQQELTGRENIFLNGAILGMTQAEIKKKFDEIVDFAEVEKFIDTPVKHYSSGMYMRLAFSIAAHLDPEILIVDEVLAVGDAEFQKKCLGKMNQVSKEEGRTVLFVSHNIASIQELCNKSIVLDQGMMNYFGLTGDAINKYSLKKDKKIKHTINLNDYALRKNSLINSNFKFSKVQIINSKKVATNKINLGETFYLRIYGNLDQPSTDLDLGFGIESQSGYNISNCYLSDSNNKVKATEKGSYSFEVRLYNYLTPGTYYIDLGASGSHIRDWIPNAIEFCVEPLTKDGKPHRLTHSGVIKYPSFWEITKSSNL